MKIFITGGAGFIGSHIVDLLLKKRFIVTVYDNFSTGKKDHLRSNRNLRVISGDVLDTKHLENSIKNHDIVYHFSANADVRKGSLQTDLDLQQETIATYNILNAMRKHSIKKIVFPSSMTVYGKSTKKMVREDYGPCLPVSLYAAGKLASEGMISAFCEIFGFQAWILRFANVIGPRLTHGVVYDLINKLLDNTEELKVLGSGDQTKPYIYVEDVTRGIEYVVRHAKRQVNLFNIGVSDTISVKEIVKTITKIMKLKHTKIRYGKTQGGWAGDVVFFKLDTAKVKQLGFVPGFSSKEAIEKAVKSRLEEVEYRYED